MSDITAAKRLIAASSMEGMRLLGGGISKPCYQGRYNMAARVALEDPQAKLSPDERRLIASFIEEDGVDPEVKDRFIRNLDESLYRRIVAAAALQDRNVGEIVNEAMALWLERQPE